MCVCNAGGTMKNIVIRGIFGAVENGIFLTANLSGVKIESVDLTIRYGKNRPVFDKGIDFQPVILCPKENEKEVYSVYKRNASGVQMKNILIKKDNGEDFLLVEREERA